MPQFQPVAMIPKSADAITRAYLECAEWSGVDDEERNEFESSEDPQWEPATVLAAMEQVQAFTIEAGELLENIDDSQVGHDFWLTRCGHGTGFWDRDLGSIGDKLTEIAECFGDASVQFDTELQYLSIYTG